MSQEKVVDVTVFSTQFDVNPGVSVISYAITSLGDLKVSAQVNGDVVDTTTMLNKLDGTSSTFLYSFKSIDAKSALGYVTTSEGVPLGGQITALQKANETEYYNYSLSPVDQKVGFVEYNSSDNTLTDDSVTGFAFLQVAQGIANLIFSNNLSDDISAVLALVADELVAQSE